MGRGRVRAGKQRGFRAERWVVLPPRRCLSGAPVRPAGLVATPQGAASHRQPRGCLPGGRWRRRELPCGLRRSRRRPDGISRCGNDHDVCVPSGCFDRMGERGGPARRELSVPWVRSMTRVSSGMAQAPTRHPRCVGNRDPYPGDLFAGNPSNGGTSPRTLRG